MPSGSGTRCGNAPPSAGAPARSFCSRSQSMRTVVQKSMSSWTTVGSSAIQMTRRSRPTRLSAMFRGPWLSVKLTGRSECARKWSMQASTRGMRPSRSGSGGTRRATCAGSVMAGPCHGRLLAGLEDDGAAERRGHDDGPVPGEQVGHVDVVVGRQVGRDLGLLEGLLAGVGAGLEVVDRDARRILAGDPVVDVADEQRR